MRTKKLLSVLLAVIMVIGLIPGTVFAAEATTADAKIGDIKFETLKAAIESAVEHNLTNATITLLENCTIEMSGSTIAENTINLPDGLTLDLNGKTLTTPYQKAPFAGNNITIKNGTITNGNKQLQSYGLYLMSGSFTVEDVTTTNGINVQSGNVTLKNVDVTNPNNKYYAVYGGGNVTIESGTFKNTSKTHNTLYGNVTVYGGTFSKNPTEFVAEGYEAVQADGKYTVQKSEPKVAEVNGTQYKTLDEAIVYAETGDTIKLLSDIEITTNTVFSVSLDLNGHAIKTKDNTVLFNGENITIKNGTFEAIGSKDYYLLTVDNGSATIENLTVVGGGVKIRNDAVVTMSDNDIQANPNQFKYAVWAYGKAQVTIESGTYFGGKNGYDVFEEGKANIVANGGTYKFKIVERNIENQDLAAVENADGTYTVMVPGIRTYEQLVAAIAAAKDGDTIKLDADIVATGNIIINKSLTLDLGEYTITGNTDEAVLRAYSDDVDTVINVTINATNGGIKNNGLGYAIYAGEDLAGGNDEERSNLTINGGNYETAGTDAIRQIMGLCTINGGSYKSSYGRTVLNGKRWYGSEFKINGGKFYNFNPACVSVWTSFDGNDQEGSFYHQHDIIAEGKTAEYADGWYTVVDGTYTAKVQTKSLCYPSLAAALDAAINLNDVANLGYITLLADDTLDLGGETIELPKGLVIDLNGHTLTVPYQKTWFAGNNITIKNGTITTGANESYGLYIMSGSFTLEDITCTNGINVQAGTVTMENCNVTNPNSRYYAVYAGTEANVTILSGTYQNPYNNRGHNALYGSITVYGGSFSKTSPNDFVAKNENLHVVKSGNWYTVYEGFQNALDAAVEGDTVYLMSDIEVAETITIDKSITLDLGESTITSTAAKNVIYSTADLTIDATTGGVYSETAYVAVGQDNGVCTINGGSFKASGDTGDHANGKPVYNTLVLNNSDFESGVTGSFKINGGKFYMFNPGCMSVNKHDHHDHDSIATGKIAALDEDGWFTVTEGEFKYQVVCHPTSPASAHQHCFATYDEAEMFIEMMGNCQWDKIVNMDGTPAEKDSTDKDFDGIGGLF